MHDSHPSHIPSSAELFSSAELDPALQALLETAYPWQILAKLDIFLAQLTKSHHEAGSSVHPSAVLTGPVYLAAGASIGAHALIEGPAWLGRGAQVGHGAYLRGGVVLAASAKVGHSSEVKHALLLPQASAPHFNYIGDSIVGRGCNLGAGVKLANFHSLGQAIYVAGQATGLRKLGAILGDGVMIGCNAVLAPGTIVGAESIVYSGALLRGIYPAKTVIKVRQTQQQSERLPQKNSR